MRRKAVVLLAAILVGALCACRIKPQAPLIDFPPGHWSEIRSENWRLPHLPTELARSDLDKAGHGVELRAICFTGYVEGPQGEIPGAEDDIYTRGSLGELAIDIRLKGLPAVAELKNLEYSRREEERRAPGIDHNGPDFPEVELSVDDISEKVWMSNYGNRIIVPIYRAALEAYPRHLSELPFPSIDHILTHRAMRIFIPLANGELHSVFFDAGDSTWRAFLKRCESVPAMRGPPTVTTTPRVP